MWSREFDAVKRIVARYHIQPGNALEVGGGPTVVMDNAPQRNPMLELVPDVVFLDAGFIANYGKPHIVADFTVLGQIENLEMQFDSVFSFQTIEHVRNPFTFARHMVYVVRPGGWIFLTSVFSFAYHPSPEDHWRFSPTGLALLFQNTDTLVRWAGWGLNQGGVMLFGQRQPSDMMPLRLATGFEEFITQ